MKIGLDLRHVGKQRTGDESVFAGLVRALAAIDRENQYVLFVDNRSPTELATLSKTLGLGGAPNFTMKNVAVENRFHWTLFGAARETRTERLDVFHTQYIVPFGIPATTRVFTHIHDVSFARFPELIGWQDRLFLSLLIPRSLRRADRIIAVSAFTKGEIAACYGVPEGKIAVVPNAPDPAFLKPADEAAKRRARERYHLPERYILSVATFQPRKNLALLVEAFAKVEERLPDTTLVLAGNPEGHHADPEVAKRIRALGLAEKVLLPGYVASEDLPAVYALARASVSPSRYEGFGLPLLEAFSQDVPVAASDIPPHREVAGAAALLVPEGSLAAWSEALYNISIESALRERLRSAGQERVRFFSWEESARALLSVYAATIPNTHP